MLSQGEIDAIRLRCENATKGPWETFVTGRDMDISLGCVSFIRTNNTDIEMIGATEADCDFIANARQDIPLLLMEIERLKKLTAVERADSGTAATVNGQTSHR